MDRQDFNFIIGMMTELSSPILFTYNVFGDFSNYITQATNMAMSMEADRYYWLCHGLVSRILRSRTEMVDAGQRDSLLSKIARLYYVEDFNQKAISDKLNISLATVSRNLSRAKEKGIVEIVIHDTRSTESQLEINIEKQFSLKECIVTRSYEKSENTLNEAGYAVSDVLSRLLNPGDTFGVSWGETLRAVAENLMIDRPRDVNVIPIIGAMGELETGIYPNAIAASFAQKLGGKSYLINAPAVLDNKKIRESIEQDRNFSGIRSWWDKLSAAIISVSTIDKTASVARHGIFNIRELTQLRELGVACASNFNFIDESGNSVITEIDDRMIKINIDELRKIRDVIVVACGVEKAEPIRAALYGNFVDILIVDHETAELIIAET
jgi:DNA-binding transcriptional regulator LsrR (DeoR family)